MKFINKSLFALLAISAMLVSSCDKVELAKELGDRGQTIVKFMTSPNDNGSNYNLSTIELASTPQTVALVDIRRDAPNETELNKVLSVTVKEDPAAISAFNNANGSNLVALPSGSYTVDPSNPRTGSDYTVTFQPGEFSKMLKIVIPNSAALDLTKRYAIGLTMVVGVTGADGRVSFDNRTTVVEIGLKNKWDGVYEVTGAALRAGDPALSGPFGPVEREFSTSGPTSVQWQGTVPWANGSGSTLPGGYEPEITVDPATNKVISVSSASGIYMTDPVVNTAVLEGNVQRYDPATKTFYFEFTYGAGPTSRLFSFKAKYLRPR